MQLTDVIQSLANLAKETPNDAIGPIRECLDRILADERLREREKFAERQARRAAELVSLFQRLVVMDSPPRHDFRNRGHSRRRVVDLLGPETVLDDELLGQAERALRSKHNSRVNELHLAKLRADRGIEPGDEGYPSSPDDFRREADDAAEERAELLMREQSEARVKLREENEASDAAEKARWNAGQPERNAEQDRLLREQSERSARFIDHDKKLGPKLSDQLLTTSEARVAERNAQFNAIDKELGNAPVAKVRINRYDRDGMPLSEKQLSERQADHDKLMTPD